MDSLAATLSACWPLLGLLLWLVALHYLRAELQPVIAELIKSLAEQAKTNSGRVLVAGLFGLSASLAAFYDVFSQIGAGELRGMTFYQHAALWCKVFNPFIVAFLARIVVQSEARRPAP